MKNSKFDLEAEYKILPDDELKRIFKKYEKKQKLLAGIPVWILVPALVVCGLNGYFTGFTIAFTGSNIVFHCGHLSIIFVLPLVEL